MSQIVLQIPELVFQIGWFVPSWRIYQVYLRDIVSCIKVCRLWHDVLTPLLWKVYSDSSYFRRKIPEAVFQSNSKYIRYLSLSTEDYFDASQVTRLKELSLRLIDKYLDEHRQLLNANPGLSSLYLCRYSNSASVQTDDVMPLLKPLTALQRLTLSGYLSLQPVAFKDVLDRNQHLESLRLRDISTKMDPDFDDWGIYRSMKDLTFKYNPADPTWLFRLLKHCPNVETLNIDTNYWYWDEGPTPLTLLTPILREDCRKVKALTLNRTLDIHATPPSTLEYLPIIQATNNLVKLQLKMDDDFSTAMCDALLQGSAHSLEDLCLDIHGELATLQSMVSAGKVLSFCPELRHFRIVFDKYPGYSVKANKALVAQPWICSNLKMLTLRASEIGVVKRCPSSCKGKTPTYNCSIETACAIDIKKRGWQIRERYYQFCHLPLNRQKHRLAMLTAASALQHITMIDLGFRLYDRVE
ncbi:hypothetical protein BGZ94_000962 [Podila epigama]|nr:hypothetical protein BGZ94_000962 [Podila epigama]